MWIQIKQTTNLVEENFEVKGGEFVFPDDSRRKGWPAEMGTREDKKNSHCGGASVLSGSAIEQPIESLDVHPSSSCLASLRGSCSTNKGSTGEG
ncbi:hypothetical protein VP01_7499g1 [Puccinia sorghi]|uniref:Uncharacterized protein n=1 Tax=Puccinia sorghi TaxID=27349 RepID=A0A0L6UC78_9BASI|nr:hypothetical protein VP01_7499g1 [Puccinia sorghi]